MSHIKKKSSSRNIIPFVHCSGGLLNEQDEANIRARRIFSEIAFKENTTAEAVRKEIAESIDVAWSTADPAAKALQDALFPDGKPTAEFFILRISEQFK